MPALVRWSLGLGIAALLTAGPFYYYRWEYTHAKRLREVDPGRVYRSGQMTADGFADFVAAYHPRTIINLQDDYPDPDIRLGYFCPGSIKESELCRQLGVHFVFLPPDLIPRRQLPAHRPAAIDSLLAIMDDPANYPILLHCRAGLHRTGVMTAVYRIEYQHWSPAEAMRELKANGFGEWPATSANDYISQYILTYKPGIREHFARVDGN
jgi:protein tyrosine phosphatase (PTP) superfamily phosphohydrolase (DUF442 family)